VSGPFDRPRIAVRPEPTADELAAVERAFVRRAELARAARAAQPGAWQRAGLEAGVRPFAGPTPAGVVAAAARGGREA
jgi:hypothetical protein